MMTTEKTTARLEMEEEAKALGIRFNPKLPDDKLQQRIFDTKAGNKQAKQETQTNTDGSNVTFTGPSPEDISNARVGNNDLPETLQQRRMRLRKDAARLVRVRVTCMNPAKKDYNGDWAQAGNGLVGMFREFVPFGVPWHIPYICYQYLRDKEYQMWYTTKDKRGNPIRRSRLVKEFAIEVLPHLTEKEREQLASEQAATGRLDQE